MNKEPITITKQEVEQLYCMYMYACESKMAGAKSEKPKWKAIINKLNKQVEGK